MNETFAALAEPNRFRIVQYLRSGPRAVHEIEARLKLSQPQTSKHLKVLRDAGLVAAEIRAQERLYALKPEKLRRLHEWIEQYRALWDERFDEMQALVDEIRTKEKTDDRNR